MEVGVVELDMEVALGVEVAAMEAVTVDLEVEVAAMDMEAVVVALDMEEHMLVVVVEDGEGLVEDTLEEVVVDVVMEVAVVALAEHGAGQVVDMVAPAVFVARKYLLDILKLS